MRQLLPHISFATESCSSKNHLVALLLLPSTVAFDEAWLFPSFRPSQKISSSLPKRGNLVKALLLLNVFVFLKEFGKIFRCRPVRALKINLRIQSSQFGKMEIFFSRCILGFHCFAFYILLMFEA